MTMTNRSALVAYFFFALAAPSFAQDHNPNSQMLREILGEIKSIHEDMRVTESTQILLAELGMQQGVVNRATEVADEARAKLSDVQQAQKHTASELARTEEHLDQATDEKERKALTDEIERQKGNIAALKVEEQSRMTTLQEMQERLKTAQDSLNNTESELNAIIARLRPASK